MTRNTLYQDTNSLSWLLSLPNSDDLLIEALKNSTPQPVESSVKAFAQSIYVLLTFFK
jgi:hypothetical protein